MSGPRPAHVKALEHLVQYVVTAKERGLAIELGRTWDGSKDFEFVLHGRADSNYATNPDDRKSVSGSRVFLERCPVVCRSATKGPWHCLLLKLKGQLE